MFERYLSSAEDVSAITQWLAAGRVDRNKLENTDRLIALGLMEERGPGIFSFTKIGQRRLSIASSRQRDPLRPDWIAIDLQIDTLFRNQARRLWEQVYIERGLARRTPSGNFRYIGVETGSGNDDVIGNPLLPEYQRLKLVQKWLHRQCERSAREIDELIEAGLAERSSGNNRHRATPDGDALMRIARNNEDLYLEWSASPQWWIKQDAQASVNRLEAKLIEIGAGIQSPEGRFWQRDVIECAVFRFRHLNR